MRIAIIAIGSRGDVQPYVALGQGLIKAGHIVRFVTQQNFEVLVKSYGLDFWSVRGNSQDLAESQELWELPEKGKFFATLRYIQKSAEHAINEWMEDGLVACLLLSASTPNQALHLTASSVRSCVAPASGSR